MSTWTNPRITKDVLTRKAIIYLRQSSERQVQHNKESQRLQYALADRAKELGWKDIEIIDSDLGASASVGARKREGFEHLIASVALGNVGIIFSREASRLSRTDKDWCQLLEMCQLFNTLIGDAERIYDLSAIDDQLVLGIKGTMSVVELKVLKMRLLQGIEEKAKRGDLLRLLPPGYVADAAGKIAKDPNKRVQDAIHLMFQKFREIGSVRQTFKWFHDHGVELPVNKVQGGRMRIIFRRPTHNFVADVLRNPMYGGVYVYGRRPREVVVIDGQLNKRTGSLRKPEESRVFLKDHHEGYIDWATYEENQRVMRENNFRAGSDESQGAVRSGASLLTGLLRCGECGRKLHVSYWGRRGTTARYLCKGDYDAGGRYCLAFGGKTADRRFSEEVLRAISPCGIRASLEAIRRLNQEDAGQRQTLMRRLEQVEYEVDRAFEQYNEVDARNRLVASELERRWNEKLEERNAVKNGLAALDAERSDVSEEERRKLLAMGEQFAEVWNHPHCPPEHKKRIARTIVEEVVVKLATPDLLRFVIHWKGGVHTRFEMEKPRSGGGDHRTALDDLELIRKMAAGHYGDDEIARVLTKLGKRTGKGKRWNKQRVADARNRHSIPGHVRTKPAAGILTLNAAAKVCGVSNTSIKSLIESGILPATQIVPLAPFEIRQADLESKPVQRAIKHLLKTGRLPAKGVMSTKQARLFE